MVPGVRRQEEIDIITLGELLLGRTVESTEEHSAPEAGEDPDEISPGHLVERCKLWLRGRWGQGKVVLGIGVGPQGGGAEERGRLRGVAGGI